LVSIVAKKRRCGEIIEVDREALLSILRKVEELERKISEIETRLIQKG